MLFGAAAPPSGYNHRTSVARTISPPPTKASSLNSGIADDRNTRTPAGCDSKHARQLPNFMGIVSCFFLRLPFWRGFPNRNRFPKALFLAQKCHYVHTSVSRLPRSLSFLHIRPKGHGFTGFRAVFSRRRRFFNEISAKIASSFRKPGWNALLHAQFRVNYYRALVAAL